MKNIYSHQKQTLSQYLTEFGIQTKQFDLILHRKEKSFQDQNSTALLGDRNRNDPVVFPRNYD